jgi:hypothetical protein
LISAASVSSVLANFPLDVEAILGGVGNGMRHRCKLATWKLEVERSVVD